MVFILIGAVKAAKAAKLEYCKDKKRKAVISPVDGSHDMMADRASSSQAQPSGTTDWWGTTRPRDAPPPTPDAPLNHAGVGAWSRDHVMQQITDSQAENPSPTYASSASASTELSAPIPASSRGPSASTSPPPAVRPSSQRGAEMNLPASISNAGQGSDPRPDQDDDSSLLNRSPQQVDSGAVPLRRSSLEINRTLEMRHSRKVEDSATLKDPSVGDDDREAAPVKQISQRGRTGSGQQPGTRKMVEGSFEQALRQRPSVKGERTSDVNPERVGETISALARNASKCPGKKPSWMVENTSTAARNGSKGPASMSERVEEAVSREVVSALARNASKGPRRRLERLPEISPTPVSLEPNFERGARSGKVKESCDEAADGQKGISAFAGAATKKRVGRRAASNAECNNLTAMTRRATAPTAVVDGSAELGTGVAAASTAVPGTSMYAVGSMKKRTSRR